MNQTRAHAEVQLGASTRATIALYRAAQALAVTFGRDYVVPDDVKHLAEPVLAHRLLTRGWTQGGHPDAGPWSARSSPGSRCRREALPKHAKPARAGRLTLTSEGVAWLGAAFVLGGVGWFKSINLVLILAYLMAALLCLNGWLARRQGRRITAARTAHPPVFAGETRLPPRVGDQYRPPAGDRQRRGSSRKRHHGLVHPSTGRREERGMRRFARLSHARAVPILRLDLVRLPSGT